MLQLRIVLNLSLTYQTVKSTKKANPSRVIALEANLVPLARLLAPAWPTQWLRCDTQKKPCNRTS